MSQPRYTSGRNSWARCDCCGREVPYRELTRQTLQFKNIQGTLTRSNQWICRDDLDTDLQVKRVRSDAQGLHHPRPTENETILALDGWANTTASPSDPEQPQPTVPADPNQVIGT